MGRRRDACAICARQLLESFSSTAESSAKSTHSKRAHGTKGASLASTLPLRPTPEYAEHKGTCTFKHKRDPHAHSLALNSLPSALPVPGSGEAGESREAGQLGAGIRSRVFAFLKLD